MLEKNSKLNRRNAIKKIAMGTTALTFTKIRSNNYKKKSMSLKGNIKQSVCQWCYSDVPLKTLAEESKKIGLVGIDLIGKEGWDTLKEYGLISTMCYGDLEGKSARSLINGWCDKRFHKDLITNYLRHIKQVSEAGWTNLICFSGNRRGMNDQEGLKNCINGLNKIVKVAEDYGVVLHMELLNSKIDHPDYMCDNTKWGIKLCKSLDSNNFKLLYDIYHMQVMEGDIIDTIRKNHKYFGHYHTAGVPGRNEIDEKQELFYPAIMEAIRQTGFDGYVAQEFVPLDKTKLGMNSLLKAVRTCDV
tara:strand:- start:2082 stop:2987 length:906 start_codon:yes stop_codon:yes gene_type:complete